MADYIHTHPYAGAGASITLIKSVDEGGGSFIFGGFADASWHDNSAKSYGRYIPSGPHGQKAAAFLFSLRNPHGCGPTQLPLRDPKDKGSAMFGWRKTGPNFGLHGERECMSQCQLQL